MRNLIAAIFIFITTTVNSQTPNLHWNYQDDGRSYSEDRGTHMVFDHAGNIIVAGYVTSGCNGIDILVIKYSPTGDTLWQTTYNGSPTVSQDDYPAVVKVDQNNNIYIAGNTSENYFNYALTLKFDTNGNLLWDRRYLNYLSGGNDVAVDDSGNVYMCGFKELLSNKDFLLVKYNSNGVQQWVQNYSHGNHDEALALLTDVSGNVYVTGRQSGVNYFFDWATLKYNPAGVQQWVDVFANPNLVFSEEPTVMTMDTSGNIYVAGFAPLLSMSNRDYYVIKYNTSGSRIWESSFNNTSFNGDDYPVAMAVDFGGNVFVTGNSVGNPTGQDICTIKINSTGQFVWQQRIDSILQTDYARTIQINPINNLVYVGGDISVLPLGPVNRDIIIQSLDTSGNEISRRIIDGPGHNFDLPYELRINDQGNVAFTGMESMHSGGLADGDVVTHYMDEQLNPIWTRYHNGDDFTDDIGVDMAVDKAGNSYVCGNTRSGDILYDDLVIFKLNPSGQRLWEYVYHGSEESSTENATAITIDDQQNVYVTGTTDTSTGVNFRDIYTVKLNSNGQVLWERIYDGTLGGADYPGAIGTDPSGKVYVCATTVNSGTGFDATVICYDDNGTLLWATPFDDGGLAESFNAMAIDDQQNIYAAGTFVPVSGDPGNALLVKFNPSGTVVWDTTYDFGTGINDRDFFNSIALDNSGNVYTAGQSNFNFLTAKYTPGGSPEWIDNYSYSTLPDSATTIAVDAHGSVVVGGIFKQFSNADYGIVKYSSDGNFQWSQRYNVSAGSDDILTDMVLDTASNIYVTGWQTSTYTTNYNFMTLKYDSTGTFKYQLIWSQSVGVEPDYGKRIGLDSTGNIYVMGDANENCYGNVFVNGYRSNIQVLRYGQGVFSSINEYTLNDDELLIYPNPTNGQLNMILPVAVFGNENVELTFYDVAGRTIFNEMTHTGEKLTLNSESWPAGMIFYRARNHFGTKSGKVLISKD